MSKFENFIPVKPADEQPDDYQKKLDEASSLQKIRDHSEIVSPALKALALGAMMIGGFEGGRKINDDLIKNKTDISQSKDLAKKYSIENSNVEENNFSRILNNSALMSEVTLSLKSHRYLESLQDEKKSYESAMTNSKVSQEDINIAKKQISRINQEISQLNEAKKQLNDNDKNAAIERVMDIDVLVDGVKKELVRHIGSREYLNKLATEMSLSREAAKEHQITRLNNVSNLTYKLKNSSWIYKHAGGYAYYSPSENCIMIPYNIDLKNAKERDFFYESILHEALHESTQYEKGMSAESKETLKTSFRSANKYEDQDSKDYYSQSGELMVRKQILDLEMEKLGLKKYGKKFTEEHYKKLLILKKENKLSNDANEFIDHIKPEDFSNIMNNLAQSDKNSKTYFHSGWNYKDVNDNLS